MSLGYGEYATVSMRFKKQYPNGWTRRDDEYQTVAAGMRRSDSAMEVVTGTTLVMIFLASGYYR